MKMFVDGGKFHESVSGRYVVMHLLIQNSFSNFFLIDNAVLCMSGD
jgi:hypothetical protein